MTNKKIKEALEIAEANNPQETNGLWLEEITIDAGPHISAWDIDRCWSWHKWPKRALLFPGTSGGDIGIDAVASRGGELIAVQCKSRKLTDGEGAVINKEEAAAFIATLASRQWAEGWIITNGNVGLTGNTRELISMIDTPVYLRDITADLREQLAGKRRWFRRKAVRRRGKRRGTWGWVKAAANVLLLLGIMAMAGAQVAIWQGWLPY